MKEIILPKNTYRGLCIANDLIYATDNKSCCANVFDMQGNFIKELKTPCIFGAITFHDGYFYAITYSCPKSIIYTLDKDFKIIKKFNYLFHIPPKFLPQTPYEKYGVGITIKDDLIYFTLQNCQNIFCLSKEGMLIDTIESKNSDICGICYYNDNLIYADKVTGKIYMGDIPLLFLQSAYHPFGIYVYNNFLYILSSTQNKITLFNLDRVLEVNTLFVDSD